MEENVIAREPEKLPKAKEKSSGEKRKLLNEEIEELEKDYQRDSLRGAPLKLTHIDRYFYAPKSNESNKTKQILNSSYQNPFELCESTLNEIRSWSMSLDKVL